MQTGMKMGYIYLFFLCNLEDFVAVRQKRTGGKMISAEQRARINFQWLEVAYCLGLTTSERESKLKGSMD